MDRSSLQRDLDAATVSLFRRPRILNAAVIIGALVLGSIATVPVYVLFNRSVIERQVWRDEWMTSIAAGMTTMIVTAIVAAIAMVVGRALLWPRWIASAAREYGIDPLVLRDHLANGPVTTERGAIGFGEERPEAGRVSETGTPGR